MRILLTALLTALSLNSLFGQGQTIAQYDINISDLVSKNVLALGDEREYLIVREQNNRSATLIYQDQSNEVRQITSDLDFLPNRYPSSYSQVTTKKYHITYLEGKNKERDGYIGIRKDNPDKIFSGYVHIPLGEFKVERIGSVKHKNRLYVGAASVTNLKLLLFDVTDPNQVKPLEFKMITQKSSYASVAGITDVMKRMFKKRSSSILGSGIQLPIRTLYLDKFYSNNGNLYLISESDIVKATILFDFNMDKRTVSVKTFDYGRSENNYHNVGGSSVADNKLFQCITNGQNIALSIYDLESGALLKTLESNEDISFANTKIVKGHFKNGMDRPHVKEAQPNNVLVRMLKYGPVVSVHENGPYYEIGLGSFKTKKKDAIPNVLTWYVEFDIIDRLIVDQLTTKKVWFSSVLNKDDLSHAGDAPIREVWRQALIYFLENQKHLSFLDTLSAGTVYIGSYDKKTKKYSVMKFD